ncbi:hypothetical protein AALB53_10025 [Lachnospiraceae bacterium 47-T17]
MAGEKIYIADKETLDKVYNILASDPVYGFIEHNDILSPSARIEYIGLNKNYSPLARNKENGSMVLNSWADFPVIKANKPYMVRADGTPDYRLKETDYTQREDGGSSDVANSSYNGGAFSWLMKIYKNEEMVGNDRIVRFSLTARDGYEPVGFIDPSNNELGGVWLPMFYGSILGADGATPKMVSLANLQPTYNNTTDKEKTAITNFSSRAAFLGGPIVETIIDLLIMFAKTTNLQEAYGYGNCSGYDASQSPTYGVKRNAVVGGGQFYGTDDKLSLNKIFHSIVLGSYQQWMRDPYEVVVNGRVKVSKNYTYDPTGAKYTDTGITVPDNKTWDTNHNALDYPAHFRTVPGYGSIPALGMDGGSSATGGCDGLWRKDPKQTFTGVCLRFGSCPHGLDCGPWARAWNYGVTYAYWTIGAADLLLPPVGVAV